ncbi:N-acetylmuramyl-L-alanine amidase [Cellulophaga phage phi46:1]|uniref:amidase n=1 Tax=Cellulophaga phage phi46:1 TaxID=1327974 RepID=UPI0003515ED2|nr:amidase [Cellulophaga phage phi46:1]AGO47823.1 N-acetylmuramyl-L-alanine amidase [Cellulophaga phage phi46:1]
MRTIKYIVLHCTATVQHAKVENIIKYWRNVLKWKSNGYHFIIESSGKVHNITPIENVANGVAGYNSASIHISYIGGIDKNGKALDNRTPEQIEAQKQLIRTLTKQFPNAEIKGHRDFPNVRKDCPSFDVKSWLKTWLK